MDNHRLIRMLLTVIGIFIALPTVSGQDFIKSNGNSGFQLIEEGSNPAIIALAQSGTARSRSSFSLYNPASPAVGGISYCTGEYGHYPAADLSHLFLETGLSYKEWFFGFSLKSESVSDLFRVDDFGHTPVLTTSSSWQFSTLSLDAATKVYEDVAIGICINGSQDRIFDFRAYSLTFGIGIFAQPLTDQLTVGLALLHAGTTKPMASSFDSSSWGKGEHLPTTGRIGILWHDTISTSAYSISADVVYRTVRDHSRPFSHRLGDRLTLPIGVEVQPFPNTSVRLGKRFNHPTELMTFGFGLQHSMAIVDVSCVIPRLVGNTEFRWMTGVTVFIPEKTKKQMVHTAPAPNTSPQSRQPATIAQPAVVVPQRHIDSVVIPQTEPVATPPATTAPASDSITTGVVPHAPLQGVAPITPHRDTSSLTPDNAIPPRDGAAIQTPSTDADSLRPLPRPGIDTTAILKKPGQ
ncbi:MAG: hypothetical protein JW795_01855 [Chitinivibrionales bacterium]|nr:hypothetical protein [Chitinivibrionales bacterium]